MPLVLSRRRPHPRRWMQRKTGWIGIDIGCAAIKLVQLELVGGRYEIARSLLLRAPQGALFDRRSVESGEVAHRIRNGLATHGGFVGSSAACVLSMSQCGLRTVMGELDTERGLDELIAEQLKTTGSAIEAGDEIAYWDGVTSQQGNRKGMTQVHVLSVRGSLAESVGTSLLDARLTCRVLDCFPFCAIRAVGLHCVASGGDTPGGYSAVLDLGWSGASLIVTHEGRPLYVRSLKDCGISELVRAVMDHLKLDRTQAFTLLINHGLAGATGVRPSDLNQLLVDKCMPLIQVLQREVRATFDFVHAESAEFTDGPIMLLGSGGVIPGLAEHISAAIGQPVECWKLDCRSSALLPCCSLFAHAASLSALAWEI